MNKNKKVKLYSILTSMTLLSMPVIAGTSFLNHAIKNSNNPVVYANNEEESNSIHGSKKVILFNRLSWKDKAGTHHGLTKTEDIKNMLSAFEKFLHDKLNTATNNKLNPFLLKGMDFDLFLKTMLDPQSPNFNPNFFEFSLVPIIDQLYNIDLYAYINGEINKDPHDLHARFLINFHDVKNSTNKEVYPHFFKWPRGVSLKSENNIFKKGFGVTGKVEFSQQKYLTMDKVKLNFKDFAPYKTLTIRYQNEKNKIETLTLQEILVSPFNLVKLSNTFHLINNAYFPNSPSFDMEIKPILLNESGLTFDISFTNITAKGIKTDPGYNDGWWKVYDQKHFAIIYPNWNKLGDPHNVKLWFEDINAAINIPFDINKLFANIGNVLNQTQSISAWQDNYDSIANDLILKAKSQLPVYLKNAFEFDFVSDIKKEAIQWVVKATDLNNGVITKKFTTKLNVPERPNLALIYKELKNYIENPIKLISNSSNYFSSNTIPSFVINKFDEELRKGAAGILPTTPGYVISKANLNAMVVGPENKYYRGNSTNSNPNWSHTNRIIDNQTILINYVKALMQTFWSNHGSKFAGANATGNIAFETDKNKKKNYITVRFEFTNLNSNQVITNQPSPWDFRIPVSVETTQFVSVSGVEDRLVLEGNMTPFPENGKVVLKYQTDQRGPDGKPLPTNDGFRIAKGNGKTDGGIRLFFTPTKLNFSVLPDQNEKILVNGNELPILNLQAQAILNFPSEKNNENQSITYPGFKEYKIQVLSQGSEIYKLTIYIGQSAPVFDISYYAWNPDKNPEQQILITPKLPDGSDNPNYNPNIDPKTGTITQLLWINTPSDVPMYVDPYYENGKPTGNKKDGWLSTGFLAAGIVVNKGIKLNFDEKVASVYRTGIDLVDGKLKISQNPTGNSSVPNDIGLTKKVNPSSDINPYFSYSGKWIYSAKSQFPGQQSNINNYGTWGHWLVNVVDESSIDNAGVNLTKFSDTLPKGQTVAVPFWTTYHGTNLKQYLVNKLGLKEADIEKMPYYEILQWWNLYSHEALILQSGLSNITNLDLIRLNPIKLNESNKDTIRQTIIDEVKYLLKEYNLVYEEQYSIIIDEKELDNMIHLYSQYKKSTITVKIEAAKNQELVVGKTSVKIINDPNLLNLNKKVFPSYKIKFLGKDIEELKQIIIKDVEQTLTNFKVNDPNSNDDIFVDLKYGLDFDIDFSNIDQLLIDEFNPTKKVQFKINALSSSNYIYGSSIFNVINSSKWDPELMVNFSLIKVQNIEFNIFNKKPEKAKIIISNYIFAAIRNAFEKFFKAYPTQNINKEALMFEWNENIYSTDYIVYPSNYGIDWEIPNYEEKLNQLVQNIDEENFTNNVIFDLNATENSLIAKNGSVFSVSNSKVNDTNPNVPGMPENPNDLIPDAFNKKDLWYLFLLIPAGIVLGAISYLIYYRIKTKKLK